MSAATFLATLSSACSTTSPCDPMSCALAEPLNATRRVRNPIQLVVYGGVVLRDIGGLSRLAGYAPASSWASVTVVNSTKAQFFCRPSAEIWSPPEASMRDRLHWLIFFCLFRAFTSRSRPAAAGDPGCTSKHRHTHAHELVVLSEAVSRNQARGQKQTPNYSPDSLHVTPHEGRYACLKGTANATAAPRIFWVFSLVRHADSRSNCRRLRSSSARRRGPGSPMSVGAHLPLYLM